MMQFLNTDKANLRKIRNLPLQSTKNKVVLVVVLALVYVTMFLLLVDSIGSIVAAFLIVPVFFVGVFFGSNAGLWACLLGVGLNFLLLTNLEKYTPAEFFQLWPGYLVILLIGFISGYFHDEAVARNRIDNEFESRERFIALINIATKSIAGTKKQEEAYYRLIMHLTNLFTADYAYLIHWDEANKRGEVFAATNNIEKPFSPSRLDPGQTQLVETVLQTRHPMFVEDISKLSFVINPSPYNNLSLQTKSALAIPLLTEEYCFGAVILAFDTPHKFSPEEIVYVELAGSQIALALRTLKQQVEIESKLKEAEALAKIEHALSESERVGVDKVLQLIVDSANALIPKAKNVILHLLDDDKQILVPRAVTGITGRAKGKLNMRPGEGIAGQVMATGELITIADVRKDERFLSHTKPINFNSLVVAPIKSHDECIGTISIHSDEANAFSEGEITLLKTLGTQVSIAIDNANLLESLENRVQKRTHDLVVLYNLITIISENWQLQDLLELSLVLTLETMKVDRGIIYLADGNETQRLTPIVQRGFADGFQIVPGSLPDDELARHVFDQHKPIALEHMSDLSSSINISRLKSYAGIPILVRGEVRGVFSLFGNEKGVFGPDEMALLISIADHLGIGIENSILFEQSRENAVLEERNRLARNLHDSVTQLLYSLTLMAGSTRKMLERGHEMDDVKTSLVRLEDTARQALKEMRLLLYELRPAVLDSEGLASALQHRIETVEERLGVKVDLFANNLPELPGNMQDALYHIALEALNNVVKHSNCTSASIRFANETENIVMEITDFGKGFDPNQYHSGLGLRNMRERGHLLGGEVVVDSKLGVGTRVLVKMKIPSILG